MSRKDDSEQLQQPADHEIAGNVKKPYWKPTFRHELVFETMALACGKVNQTQAACHMVRKNS